MNLIKEQTGFSPVLNEKGFFIDYDWKANCVVGIFKGKVTVDDIIAFWDDLMKNDAVPSGTKGVVLDFSDARLAFKASAYMRIVDFFVENISFVGRYKIGVIANNPHNIVVLMLIARENFMYELRPFTTLGACLVWIKG
ncbi:hypothetical protein [Marinilabilia sp.]|uniref:hypothetical protein n=1 Tax=Marinilabilia sp. TaxID=2021252 RepID=UPI0025B9FFD4|nr:hypothetical protein [Marinilabilia sp.]